MVERSVASVLLASFLVALPLVVLPLSCGDDSDGDERDVQADTSTDIGPSDGDTDSGNEDMGPGDALDVESGVELDLDEDASSDLESDAPPLADWPAFALGVEYTQLGLAEGYAASGVTWAKTRLEAFTWGASEPDPPDGSIHTYDWTCTDGMIREFQDAGIVNIQSYLSPHNPWGSVAANGPTHPDIMPSPEHMDDYRVWVHALIERYDGDGHEDMPGLVVPVRYWVVGPEWTGFWPSGDHEDYLELARVTAEEARDAYPEVRLGTIPFLLGDVFTGNEPSDEEIESRLATPFPLRQSAEGVYAILDHPEYFDYVSIHSLEDYTEVPPTLAWFREQMGGRGYSMPLWFDDAFPMGALANFYDYPAVYPVLESQQDAIWALLDTIAKEDGTAGPPYSVAIAWLRALAASGTVKKVVTALGEGAVGIQIGNTEDWMADPGHPALRESFMALIGASAAFGMLDVDHRNAYGSCDTRYPGDPRPAFRNLELLVELLGGGDFDVRQRLGENEGIRGYRFERDGVPLWVLWNEDGILQLPGDPQETPVAYALPVPGDVDEVLVTRSVTDLAAPFPTSEMLTVESGQVHLSLDSVPVFVQVR